MKQKLFTLLLAVAASVGTMFAWNDYNKCGDNLTWSYNEGTITISGTGDMYDYYNNSSRFWNQGYYDIAITDIKKIIIEEGVTSIGDFAFGWAQADCPVTEVIISNTVARIGKYAFWCCSSLTSIIIPESVTSISESTFNGCASLSDIFVPCGRLKQFKEILGAGSYQVRYLPLLYTVEGKSNDPTYGKVSVTANVCEGSFVAAIPTRGYQFVCWADGNTENPRTIELTQDTTMEAIFDYLLEGKCGKDSALTWTLDTTTMALNITGSGALSENYTYAPFIQSLTIGNSVTSIGGYAFGECESLKTVVLGSSVKVLEAAAFAYCSSIDTITCYSQRPPTVNQDALYGLDYSTIVYVPASYLNYYVMHDAWGLYDVRPMGIALTLSANNAAYGTLVGAGTYAQNATVTFSAKPNNGYHFVRWTDGNTENPRTIILTQDTTFTAVFETSKSGVCGHNNALQWTYDGQSRTLTITGRAALDENYTFGVEALTQMRTLIIRNDVTAIGDSAFYGVSSIYHLEIGANVASIGNYSFAECRRLEDITCYAEDVPVINATTFDNVGNKQYIYLYVPDGRERAYKRDEFWGEFDVQVKGAETVSNPVDDVIVNPSDNTADITWPVVNNAGTYEITITKDDVVVCTLIFNANGQLAGIAFAPGKEGRAHYAQAATLTANGFRFTITGLTSATKYGYSVVSKNTSNAVVDTKSGTFTTTGSQQVPTNLDQIGSSQDGTKGRLVLHNGQVLILRGEKAYTITGQEIK